MKGKFELFLEKAYHLVSMYGMDAGNLQACQYQLILEADLNGVTDRVAFQAVRWSGARPFMTEIRLEQRDAFVANEWGLFLLNTAGERDVQFEEHTFPDPQYFTEEEVQEGGIFYNGDLSLIVNNLVVLPKVRTDKFRTYWKAPDRRASLESGLQETGDTLLLLVGSKNVYFNLDLPRRVDLSGSNIRLRLRLGGLLFRNATIIT